MSLLSRLMARAGQGTGTTAPARPKGATALRRMEDEEAQPMARAPLARQEEEEAVQSLARTPAQNLARQQDEEDEPLPVARMEEEEEAQTLRRAPEEEGAQAIRRQEEEEALPLARMEEEEEAQAIRRQPEEEEEPIPMMARTAAPASLVRMEEEEEAQTLHRVEEEEAAQPLFRMEEEEEAQAIRRQEEQEEASPLRRDAVHRQPPPDATGLTAETSPAPSEIAMEDDTPPAMILRREGLVTAPGVAEGSAQDFGTGFDPAPPPPDWMPAEPIISNPDQGSFAAPEGDSAANVVIEQIDVIIEEPSGGRASAPRPAPVDYAAMAKRRYLGGL